MSGDSRERDAQRTKIKGSKRQKHQAPPAPPVATPPATDLERPAGGIHIDGSMLEGGEACPCSQGSHAHVCYQLPAALLAALPEARLTSAYSECRRADPEERQRAV